MLSQNKLIIKVKQSYFVIVAIDIKANQLNNDFFSLIKPLNISSCLRTYH